MLITDLLLKKRICFHKYLCFNKFQKEKEHIPRGKKKFIICSLLVFCFIFKANLHDRLIVLWSWTLGWVVQDWNWPMTLDSRGAIRNTWHFRKWNLTNLENWKTITGKSMKKINQRGWKTAYEEMGKKPGNPVEFRELR